MIHIAICDDEPVQVRLLSQLVGDWFAGQGEACEILSYPSAEALLFLGRSILRRTFCCWTF